MLELMLLDYRTNREYRDRMEKQAEQERFLSSLAADTEDSDSTSLPKTMLAWTGRRLMESGNFLLSLADQPGYDQSLAR
jgi:hypothetical protein